MQFENRFSIHKDILKSFSCLLPKNSKDGPSPQDKDAAKKLFSFYMDDLDLTTDDDNALIPEISMWYRFLNQIDEPPPKTAISALNICNKDFHPNVFKLLQIFVTLPISTCSAERSFSTLKRIKTYL